MKYIYTTIIFAVLLVSCKDKEKAKIERAKTDWEFYKLKGDVKTLSFKTEAIDKSKGAPRREDGSEYDTDYTFNESGMLISEKKYLHSNKIFQELTYNGRDKIVKQVQYANASPSVITEYAWDKDYKNNTAITKRNPDNTQLERIGMKYNAEGKVTERIVYNRQDIPVEKITYDYDDKGNMKSENFYLDSDGVQVSNIYEYTGPNKTGEIKVRPDGSVIYKTFYEYNSNNKLIKSGTTDGTGKLQYAQDITYDKNGNVLTINITEPQENITTTDKYTYDSKNNKTSWINLINGQPGFIVKYNYDKNNNIILVSSSDDKNNITDSRQYTYQYDKAGNWIKKTVTVNGRPLFIVNRTISYFNNK